MIEDVLVYVLDFFWGCVSVFALIWWFAVKVRDFE
jgi:hypothetical protein